VLTGLLPVSDRQRPCCRDENSGLHDRYPLQRAKGTPRADAQRRMPNRSINDL
jgi:hypothetical protein